MGCNCNNCSVSDREFALTGTGLKYAVNYTCEGFDIDTDDWTITVTRGRAALEYTRDNATKDEEEGIWYITIDTTDLAPGDVYVTFDAYVPDSDFEDGVRHEIDEQYLITLQEKKKK